MDILRRLLQSEDGQDLIEYSLLIVFVALAGLLIMQRTGSSIQPIWAAGSSELQNAALQTS